MPNNANVDIIANGHASGDFARMIQSGGSLNVGAKRPFIGTNGKSYISMYKGGDPTKKESWGLQLVANATLRRDEWKQLDAALISEKMYRLGGIDDLKANGLVYNLGNAMGTTVLEWHDVAGKMTAITTMDGITRSEMNRPNYQTNYLPIPITHVDYEINTRALATSRNMGNPLDVTDAAMAARAINEKLENMLFTNITYGYGDLDDRSRNKIYSYLNFPDINLVTLGTAWDASAKTPKGILQDVSRMISSANNALFYGPFMLYLPKNYGLVLYEDYDTTTPGKTIKSRISEYDMIKGIKVIDTLPDDTILLVQMTPDVVRLVNGLGLTNIEWKVEGDFLTKYKAFCIQVPQIRSDQNGNCGIVKLA
jgi:uncharacterized linocin/CFP29 family protein